MSGGLFRDPGFATYLARKNLSVKKDGTKKKTHPLKTKHKARKASLYTALTVQHLARTPILGVGGHFGSRS